MTIEQPSKPDVPAPPAEPDVVDHPQPDITTVPPPDVPPQPLTDLPTPHRDVPGPR